jgi:iron-sulfur cluster repair protein YtfE (RIC family)
MAEEGVETFVHDHARLTALVTKVRDRLAAPPDSGPTDAVWDDLTGLIEELEDVLFTHFSREEEALFPFLIRNVPAISAQVGDLGSSHDAICKSLLAVSAMAREEGSRRWAAVAEAYELFIEGYALHSRHEHDLFDSIGTALSAEQRAELRALLDGL